MAILITEGTARPELDPATGIPDTPPPIVMAQVRRRRPSSEGHITDAALRSMWTLEDEPGTYLPSPDVISAECAAIRSTWSQYEHYARSGLLSATGKIPRWVPPGTVRGLRGEA